ncbi:MAG: UvrD-helicase domain-containing protein, partial [Fidelibacterota bacterium]
MSNLSDALNLNLNVVIRACAGAGKTYALTKRYLTILDSFAKSALRTRQNQWQGPPNILVITYTNKATDEMSGRIYQELHRIIYGKTTDDLNIGAGILQNPDYADWIIESFNRAQIMTIDALCNKIIRENPISAGVDPSFSVSDESQLKPIISGCLKSFLQKLSDEDDPRLNRLSTSISYHHLINVLNYLIAHEFDLLVSSNYSIPANPSAMVEQWRSDYEPKIPIEEIIHKCRTVLTQLIKLNPPHDQLENLKNVQHHIETIFQIKPEEQLSYYKENIHPFWVTKGGTYFRQTHYLIGNAKLWEQTYGKSHHRDDADALIKELLSYLNDVIPIEKLSLILTQNDFDCAESIMDLLSILKEFIPKLREIKLHENILSYQDVINLTHQVLTANPTIAERYGNQYAHIMVDEFQDTNDQRWEIIQKIASFGGKLRKSGIFLVGDEKQSIYRFQKADVKVMNFAEETLLNSDQPANIISFNDNYRSSSEFLHKAVNPIFSKLFRPPDEELKPYETGFIPTTYPENKPLQARDYDVNLGGSVWVDLLTVSKSDKTSFRENHLAYPRHVAKMIKEFQTTPQYQKCQVNPGEPKIGVLLRTIENNAPTFREAFQIEGLDFEIVSGRGLFSRQEVKDIEMLLALLLNPYDDVALIGILRSPLFSFDDNELTSLLAPDRQGLPVYKIVEESLPDVFSEIEGWRSESTSIPVDRLLEKIFRAPEREFGYLSEPDGDQRWKNILKCIRLIHQWSVNGDDKAEIHQKILDRIQHRYSGDMAPLSTSSEVVVMSIHKAKGLQFPFVVIADLHRKFNFSHSDVIFSGMLNTKFELGLTLSKVDGSEGSTVLAYLLKQQNKQENFAEYFRQLYVAVTRAKYGVIFSGVITELKNGLPEFKPHTEINSQFLDWIREIYG